MNYQMKQYGLVSNDNSRCKMHIRDFKKEQHGTAIDDLGRRLIAKQGGTMQWHFALYPDEPRYPCDDDDYKSNKGEWHKDWQSYSPPSHVEVYKRVDGVCHIADMIDKNGNVVEFQHSNIGTEDVQSRELTYGNMYWVIDATKSSFIQLSDGKILVKESDSWWRLLNKSIILDIGKGVACVNQHFCVSNSEGGYICVKYYLCTFYTYEHFISSLFVLNEPFNLLPKHQNKCIDEELKFEYISDDNDKLIILNAYDHEWLKEFGFNSTKRLEIYTSKEIADQMDQLYKLIKYQNDTRSRFNLPLIPKCIETNITHLTQETQIFMGICDKISTTEVVINNKDVIARLNHNITSINLSYLDLLKTSKLEANEYLNTEEVDYTKIKCSDVNNYLITLRDNVIKINKILEFYNNLTIRLSTELQTHASELETLKEVIQKEFSKRDELDRHKQDEIRNKERQEQANKERELLIHEVLKKQIKCSCCEDIFTQNVQTKDLCIACYLNLQIKERSS